MPSHSCGILRHQFPSHLQVSSQGSQSCSLLQTGDVDFRRLKMGYAKILMCSWRMLGRLVHPKVFPGKQGGAASPGHFPVPEPTKWEGIAALTTTLPSTHTPCQEHLCWEGWGSPALCWEPFQPSRREWSSLEHCLHDLTSCSVSPGAPQARRLPAPDAAVQPLVQQSGADSSAWLFRRIFQEEVEQMFQPRLQGGSATRARAVL